MDVLPSTRLTSRSPKLVCGLLLSLSMIPSIGCGTIREQRATDQLLLSDAVDRSVASIDFSPLAYEKVYLDSRFLQFKNASAITSNYVISSIRQQMTVAGCLLQDSIESADYVVEARVGTMGADGHEMNYGVPASGTVNAAASLVSGTPPLPMLPEISLARRTHDMAAVKIAAFAYKRETRLPVWQSGESLARSRANSLWILGAGPFKSGSIYSGTEFNGQQTFASRLRGKKKSDLTELDYAFRSTEIWDSKLKERFDNGEIVPPSELEEDKAEIQVAEEKSESEAR